MTNFRDMDEILDKYYAPIKLPDNNRTGLIEALNRHYYQKFLEMLPEKQEIVTLTEPPQGIDRLWLEGRDCGVTAGYNSAIYDIEAKLKLLRSECI